MKFKKEFLVNLVYEEYDKNKVDIIDKKMVDQRRWVTVYEMIFKYRGSFYVACYDLASTENQESEPFEYDADDKGLIECAEVIPVEKTIIEYEVKK